MVRVSCTVSRTVLKIDPPGNSRIASSATVFSRNRGATLNVDAVSGASVTSNGVLVKVRVQSNKPVQTSVQSAICRRPSGECCARRRSWISCSGCKLLRSQLLLSDTVRCRWSNSAPDPAWQRNNRGSSRWRHIRFRSDCDRWINDWSEYLEDFRAFGTRAICSILPCYHIELSVGNEKIYKFMWHTVSV